MGAVTHADRVTQTISQVAASSRNSRTACLTSHTTAPFLTSLDTNTRSSLNNLNTISLVNRAQVVKSAANSLTREKEAFIHSFRRPLLDREVTVVIEEAGAVQATAGPLQPKLQAWESHLTSPVVEMC